MENITNRMDHVKDRVSEVDGKAEVLDQLVMLND